MNYNKKTVKDIDVAGKKVLLRCDFNVPQDKATGAITDPDAPQPNMDVLRACYEASSQSVQNGDNGYALSGLKAAE